MERIAFLFTTIMLLGWSINAQNVFRQKITGNLSSLTVKISNLTSEIDIEGHSSDEIVIEAEGYRGIPEKAKGLKPLSAYGEDNTAIGLFFSQKGNVVEISGVSRASNDADYLIKIPKDMKLIVNSESYNADDIEVSNMKNEIEIKANSSSIELEDVTGPLVLNALNGEITVKISSFSQAGPSSINATNGDVEITMPSSSKAEFKLSCLNGEIYTNLDMSLDQKNEQSLRRIGGGMRANGKTNGGGAEFTIYALNGNIYLRGE